MLFLPSNRAMQASPSVILAHFEVFVRENMHDHDQILYPRVIGLDKPTMVRIAKQVIANIGLNAEVFPYYQLRTGAELPGYSDTPRDPRDRLNRDRVGRCSHVGILILAPYDHATDPRSPLHDLATATATATATHAASHTATTITLGRPRNPAYSFHALRHAQPGASITDTIPIQDHTRYRAAAYMYAQRHGMRFVIKKMTDTTIKITKTA
jgi:hypothetical protein